MGVEWKSVKDHYVKKFSSKKLLSLFCSECDFDICGYGMVARLDKILKGDRSYNAGRYHEMEYRKYKILEDTTNGRTIDDHGYFYRNRKTNETAYVVHPYRFDDEYNLLLNEWCRPLDLDFIAVKKECSFYNPGHTYMIVLFQKGSRIGKVKYLLDNAIYQ